MTHADLSAAPANAANAWSEALVAVRLDGASYLLDDGRLARQAASCLLTPEAGDRVLAAACRGGDYILHVLERAEAETAELRVPGARDVALRQERLTLAASDTLTLAALRDLDATAASGTLSLHARNLAMSAQDTLVQNVRHFVGKAQHYLLEAAQLLKLHGRQALITAEQDVKVDGERISMG